MQKKPKKPWSLQKDGDLWQIFHEFVRAKGHTAVKITKVKGHALEKDVSAGSVQRKHKDGNDHADTATKRGIQEHGEVISKVASWLIVRYRKYAALIKDIHSHLIEGNVIRKAISQSKQIESEKQASKAWPSRQKEGEWKDYEARKE